MDVKELMEYVEAKWEEKGGVVDVLSDYIAVPNQSPLYDSDIFTNGYQEKAVDLLVDWVKRQKVAGLRLTVDDGKSYEKQRTPLILLEVAASENAQGPAASRTILMYGHFDKQPPLTDRWHEGFGPHKPVRTKDDKLFGRGGADDGYSVFAAVAGIKALQEQGIPHPRIVVTIEGCEESGSPDLLPYMATYSKIIGSPDLVICLDSGCGNYTQLWTTTSLRGLLCGDLTVKIIDDGVHSGAASGIVPDSFRIARTIFDRIECSKTGKLLLKEAYCEIPEQYRKDAEAAAKSVGSAIVDQFTFAVHSNGEGKTPSKATPMADNPAQALLQRTWHPTLTYTGIDGIPSTKHAGNVLRSFTRFALSMRLPPTVDPKPLAKAMVKVMTTDVPYNADVTFNVRKISQGWLAPKMSQWLRSSLADASQAIFGKPAASIGEGGSIPFMGHLGRTFPQAQFAILGVLGPNSNAHGPNESLDIGMGKGVTAAVSFIVKDFYEAHSNTKKRCL